MNRTRRYFNTNDGGTTRKANSLKGLETIEHGLETIGFIAKLTIGFREKENPPTKELQTKRNACYPKEKCKRTLSEARRRNPICSVKKNGKNMPPPISNLDPRGNTGRDSRPDRATPPRVTVLRPYMVMVGGNPLSRHCCRLFSGKFAYRDFSI